MSFLWGFPPGSDGKESTHMGRPGFNPWVRKIAWRREWQPTPVFLPGKSHEERSLVGYSPQGRKELDTTQWLSLSLFFNEFPLALATQRFWNLSLSIPGPNPSLDLYSNQRQWELRTNVFVTSSWGGKFRTYTSRHLLQALGEADLGQTQSRHGNQFK